MGAVCGWGQLAQDLGQVARGELASSTGAVAEPGEPHLLPHRLGHGPILTAPVQEPAGTRSGGAPAPPPRAKPNGPYFRKEPFISVPISANSPSDVAPGSEVKLKPSEFDPENVPVATASRNLPLKFVGSVGS